MGSTVKGRSHRLRIQFYLRFVGDPGQADLAIGLLQSRFSGVLHRIEEPVGSHFSMQIVRIRINSFSVLNEQLLPWLWSQRALLPAAELPLLCLKCAAWIASRGLHRTKDGLGVATLLTYGNKIDSQDRRS